MRWRLGYRLVVWGSLAEESTDLRHVARPMVRELADATKETAILTVYHNQDVICIDKVETSHPVRLTLEVGTHRAPHAGASSKVLMAHLPDKEIRVDVNGSWSCAKAEEMIFHLSRKGVRIIEQPTDPEFVQEWPHLKGKSDEVELIMDEGLNTLDDFDEFFGIEVADVPVNFFAVGIEQQ